jgi:hypothetical protein
MFQTLLVSLYYLVFEEFFMLATIRNLLIWISIEVLSIFFALYFENNEWKQYANYCIYVMQFINFMLWFLISLGDGSSL